MSLKVSKRAADGLRSQSVAAAGLKSQNLTQISLRPEEEARGHFARGYFLHHFPPPPPEQPSVESYALSWLRI